MSMKVLLADGDWDFARKATSYLESHAHLVVHHDTTAEALAQAERWKPDLAIVSAELAEDGLLEPLQLIAPRPAILLTGWMDRYDRVWRAWQRGGDELLMKPMLSLSELSAAIVATLESAATGGRTAPRRLAVSA